MLKTAKGVCFVNEGSQARDFQNPDTLYPYPKTPVNPPANRPSVGNKTLLCN